MSIIFYSSRTSVGIRRCTFGEVEFQNNFQSKYYWNDSRQKCSTQNSLKFTNFFSKNLNYFSKREAVFFSFFIGFFSPKNVIFFRKINPRTILSLVLHTTLCCVHEINWSYRLLPLAKKIQRQSCQKM